ncbi:hypothetical protein Hdeb2414_s0026g00677581 [Helianthus debilis subsp. tardiflorus]
MGFEPAKQNGKTERPVSDPLSQLEEDPAMRKKDVDERRAAEKNPSREANGRTLRRVSARGRAGKWRPHTLTLAYNLRRASGEESIIAFF